MRQDSNTRTAPPSPSPLSSPLPSAAATPSGKRGRDPEDEVYLDKLRSHKRYLSEVMASSLNGLTVGEETLMDCHSPARSESMFSVRDEMPWQNSPMSEDSVENRFCEASANTCSSQPDSLPTCPVSPYRYQKQLNAFSSIPCTSSYSSNGCTITGLTSTQPRQRSSDSESRLPSSPSDICQPADLRRAALLRSVQIRAQPSLSSSLELQYSQGQDPVPNIEPEEGPSSYMKSLVDERGYQIEDCSSVSISGSEFNGKKSCRMINMNVKADDYGD